MVAVVGTILVLSQLVSCALSAVIEPQAFVPVSLHPAGGSDVEARDWKRGGDTLRPRSKVELLYAQHGSDDTNPYLVSVTASHKNTSYVLVEDFEDVLSDIRCVNNAVNVPISMVLQFMDGDAFKYARGHWMRHDTLLFVTHHHSCNEGHKRGVYRFEERSLDAIIRCTYEELGDSRYASSLIRVSGGPADAHLTRRLRRRTVYPRNDGSIKSNNSAFSFDLHQGFPPRERVLEAAIEGVIETAFNFAINTDIAGVLKDLGDDFKELGKDAEKALTEFGADSKGIFGAITDAIKAVGNEIGKFFHSIASMLGLARRDKKSSADRFLRGVVQEMSISINDTTPVAAKFSIELTSNSLVAFPEFLEVRLGPRPSFGGTPAPFKIGGWTFEIAPEPLMIVMSVQMRPGTNITIPISADLAISEPLKVDLIGRSGGSMSSSLKFDRPILNTFDPTVCLNMYIGPSITAYLKNPAVKTSISLQTAIVLPRVKVCFNEEHNVDSKCAPKGLIPKALSITTTMGVGLELVAEAEIFGFTLIDGIIPNDLKALGLFHNFTMGKSCIDDRGIKPGKPLDSQPKSVVDGKEVMPVRSREVEGQTASTPKGELVASRGRRGMALQQQRNRTDRAPLIALLRRWGGHRSRSAMLTGHSTAYADR
ncbi:hypothetical protein FGG08_000519 [Glutinoglossum americanum]|uniref:DUF7029 domain-containing protein n=1 Tax=Glutinoglossum americanum TaxID=1670608 RepID=A0A9P8II12_9PEZI|nr:hypothetical protein FGG08_000519 [Glutinoglossum americanum]